MGNVSVENPVEQTVEATVLGRPFFAGWEAKNWGVKSPQFA